MIPGNFPIGCMPIYLANFQTNDTRMYDRLHCLKELNEFATFQNKFVQQTIRELQLEHPHATIIYADYFYALKGLLQHATSIGKFNIMDHTISHRLIVIQLLIINKPLI